MSEQQDVDNANGAVQVLSATRADGSDATAAVAARLRAHYLTRPHNPFWTPFIDLVQSGNRPPPQAMRLVLDRGSGPEEEDVAAGGRLYLGSAALGAFLDVTITRAVVGPAAVDVTQELGALVQRHRREQRAEMWLELPERIGGVVTGNVAVEYRSGGKERKAECMGPGRTDIQMRGYTDLPVYSSPQYGAHQDDVWDDTPFLREHPDAQIVRVTVWHNRYVFGIQAQYRLAWGRGAPLEGPRHFSAQGYYSNLAVGGPHTFADFMLMEGEFINQVSVRAGDIVDGIRMTTSSGRVFLVGGEGGVHYELQVPPNHMVRGFHGAIAGVLSRLGVVSTSFVSQGDLDQLERTLEEHLPPVVGHLVVGYVGFDFVPPR